ncbi:MAG: DnaJ domain-containing protein [Kordiimonadaceae bacterium]|nr:DnaJ domain-containing protein [Kordiimonadaceae bacterium]
MKLKTLTYGLMATALTAMPALANKADVINNYADIAVASYGDSLSSAKILQTAINALIASPSADNLEAAKAAWLSSRVPYQQTEVFRFGNAIVDDWEGKVNAWPLDEGLIDYVDASYGGATDENGRTSTEQAAFDTLEIDSASDHAAIKRQYRKLAKMYHPDANPGDPDAAERFYQVQTAYELLREKNA